MNAVAKNLKSIRTQKGYTQDDLAEALHVTRQTVSSWETGRSEPDIGMLTTLAEFLQTDVTTLIYGPAKTPYQTMQEKYKVWSLILGLFVLAGLVAYVWLQPLLLDYRRQTYDMRPGILYQTLLVPVCTATNMFKSRFQRASGNRIIWIRGAKKPVKSRVCSIDGIRQTVFATLLQHVALKKL